MSDFYTANDVINAIAAASKQLSSRKEEINRLNVFPVPDGDTGTNMSLTLETVVENLAALPIGTTQQNIRRAITNGALMGARGNSGVITSQILRGLSDGFEDATSLDTATLAVAFAKSKEVAYAAVRKPVEGTILTVLKDSADAAIAAAEEGLSTDDALRKIVEEAFASVRRTPEFLPVLKENNVVDAGGFGLAIFFEGFCNALTGENSALGDELASSRTAAPKVEIEQINDWEGSAYRYCNEFLVDSDTLDKEEALEFLATMGDCELCVGENPKFKVHVHSNTPHKVLEYFLNHGHISNVFIHNMQLQSEDRTDKLALEEQLAHKELGVVAVAPGEGNATILKSLGVDVVISGGQTMNPSTKDIMEAVERANADKVLILPNNKNIILAAQSCVDICEIPCAVVPTVSVPQGFSAMFGYNPDASLNDNLESMTDAFAEVKTGEITTAIKDSHDAHGGPIAEGDIIGIADGSIEAVGTDLKDVLMNLLETMDADEFDNLTLLAGEDLSDDELADLAETVEAQYEDLDVDPQRGEQPLYPIVFSLE